MNLWLSRNKSGTLVLWFFNEPVKIGEAWYGDSYIVLDSVQSPTFGEITPFPEVTYENSPQQVEESQKTWRMDGFVGKR